MRSQTAKRRAMRVRIGIEGRILGGPAHPVVKHHFERIVIEPLSAHHSWLDTLAKGV